MNKEINIVNIELPMHLDGDGHFEYQGKEWNNSTLYTASSGLEQFDYPLCALDMSNKPWGMTNFMWILYHIERINNANLDYPIILTPEGIICDGWHRIAKAVLNKDTTIKAVRLLSMPECDRTLSED